MEEKKTNYDKTREDAEQRFLAYDQEKMIRKFSLKADENYLYLRFVGRDYRISRKNGRIEWNREEIGKDYFEPAQAGFEETLAIMDVLCSSKDDCQLAGTYNTIDRMKSVRYAATPGSGLYTTYEKLFDENTEKLQKVLENLGGTKDHPGDAAAKLPVFDFLPVIFQFWHSDEEFPATLKFMWDENTLDYLRFETAFYVMGHILSRIKEELVRLDTRRCTIETEGFGTMVFELYPEYAPITVESFKKLSDEGFYDGLCWCRIVKDYVIQGGSRTNDIMAECDWHIKGYRYLYVTGIEEEQATEDLFTYLVMSSDLENRGSFECSDKLANEIYHIARVSDRANFYYFPTDCPHREKNGWTGDAQISAEHMILTMGAEKSWKEWLNNIRLAQDPMGRIPGIIPTGDWGFAWGNGPAWDKVLFELPYIIYKYRGDTEPIKENAHAMMSYLEYVSRQRDENGIIAIGLGDWVPVDRAADDYVSPLGFTDTVMVYLMCREAEVMFDKTGLSLNRDYAVQFGRELREAIRNQYLDLNRMLVKSSCQTAQALAIYYDIFDTGEKPEAFRRLMEIIHRDGDKMNCGFLGLRVMFHVLSDYGEAELAYRMITGPSYPSYGYFVEAGETSMPETILSDMKYRNASLNHHFLCDVVQWYMKYPGGIHVENSKKVLIRPTFISSLTYAKASHQLPDGEVSVYWKREGERIYLEVKCPDTVSCELMLDQDLMIEDSKKPYLEKGQGCWYLASCR